MNIKIKKFHKDAVVPKYAHSTDAGCDLTATSKYLDEDGNRVYGVGLGFEIPEGYVGLLFPRSSNAKKDLILSNSVGVIDANFRSEVMMKFKPSAFYNANRVEEHDMAEYEVGDRIGQIIFMPFPKVEFEVVDKLSETDRGSGGFGSTGK